MAGTMAMINSKCINSAKLHNNTKLTPSKPTTLTLTLTLTLPKTLTLTNENASVSVSTKSCLAGTAIAGAIFSSLANSDAALAASQIAEIAEGDNRGVALLLPLIPAIAWVLFNILQPALNQLNRMRSTRGLIIGLGLGLGLGASGLVWSPDASAIAEAAAVNDNRGQLLLFVVTPAIAWVLFNILQPALNQLNRMRSQ